MDEFMKKLKAYIYANPPDFGDRLAAHGLKQEVADILVAGKGVDIADGQLGFLVVKQSEFHINSSIDFDSCYYPV